MPLLYALDLLITPIGTASAYTDVLAHLARWVDPGQAVNLHSAGSAEMPLPKSVERDGGSRRARWDVTRSARGEAVRLEVSQAIVGTPVELRTTATVAQLDGPTSLRVSISRDAQGTWLSPVAETELYQPRLVRDIASDPKLQLRVGSQLVGGEYTPILSERACEALMDSLASRDRLPILAIYARTPETRALARYLAPRLVGLVRVVTLNYYTWQQMARSARAYRVPRSGAMLFWSDPTAEGVVFGPSEIAEAGPEDIHRALMSMLAPLSALARPLDRAWQIAVTTGRQDEQNRLKQTISEAREAADTSTEIAALNQRIEALTAENADWEALAGDYEARATAAESAAALVEQARASERYWRDLYTQKFAVADDVDVDPWTEVPELVPRQDPSATFDALHELAEGRIVFTDSALKSWKDINYPEPREMTDDLVLLAKVAQRIYDGEEHKMGFFDDWCRDEFGLVVAMTDQTIKKRKLGRFTFQGQTFDQTPHVKVADAVKPNAVGRIHFDLDKKGQRIIVNWVALKLY